MSEFKKARQTLNGLLKAERDLQQELKKKCDWEDPADVAEYKGRRKEKRLATLKQLGYPTCPKCKDYLDNPRSWVLMGTDRAICRSCYSLLAVQAVPGKIFTASEVRYRIDGQALANSRIAMGVSRKRFAKKAGWSYAFQYKLECGTTATVNEDIADTILQVFQELK